MQNSVSKGFGTNTKTGLAHQDNSNDTQQIVGNNLQPWTDFKGMYLVIHDHPNPLQNNDGRLLHFYTT